MTRAVNTLHVELAPGSWWTTNNMREAIPGVPTPLTWSVWRSGSLSGSAEMFYRLGLADSTEEAETLAPRGFSIVFGRPVACANFTLSLMTRMPGTDPDTFVEAIFGVPRGTIKYEVLPPVGADAGERFAKTAATQVESTRAVAAAVRVEWERIVQDPPIADTAATTLAHGVELYRAIYTEHLVMTSLSLSVFGEVAALAARAGMPGLERRLVTGQGDVEEAKIAADLWLVGNGALDIATFIQRHGYHGPHEGEVSAHSWRETPGVISAIAERLHGHDSEDPRARVEHQATERESAERDLLAALPEDERDAARALLDRARQWIPAREVGKGGFLMGLDVVRAAARVLGADLAERGLLAEPDHVFMLTFEELQDLPDDARAIAIQRAELHADYRTTDVPSVFEGMPERIPLADATQDATEVRGIPVSSGRVAGTARLIVDPTGAAPVEPGEILVCETTDPSWVSLFLDAAALVIDIGQVMSHGAIVARELGIPCVIDTKNGTKRIADGDTVEVDGDTGVVQISARAVASR